MDSPAYSVTVTHLTAGWTYSAVHNTPGDPDAPVLLMDPFTYAWAWQDGQVPGQLEPGTVTFTLYGTSAAVLPQPQRGELITFTARIGAAGPILAKATAARITDAIIDLVPDDPDRPARLTVTARDLLVDLPSITPTRTDVGRRRCLERLTQISAATGRSIGLPTALGRAQDGSPRYSADWSGNARDVLSSWAPGADVGGTFDGTLTPAYNAYPAGYSYCAADAADRVQPAIADPASTIKYVYTHASPLDVRTHKLPLRLGVVDGRLTLVPAPAADTRFAAIDAGVCDIPSRLRSSRDHAPNTIRLVGIAEWDTAATFGGTDQERPYSPDYYTGDVASAGPRAREVKTQLVLGTFDHTSSASPTVPSPVPINATAPRFVPDPTAQVETYAVDGFTVNAAQLSQAEALSALPILAPAYPGEGGDNVLLRHVTIYRIAPNARRGASFIVTGWIVSGSLRIADGQITYELTTTPGVPVYDPAVTPVTFAEFEAAAAGLTVDQADPLIAFADLNYVDS